MSGETFRINGLDGFLSRISFLTDTDYKRDYCSSGPNEILCCTYLLWKSKNEESTEEFFIVGLVLSISAKGVFLYFLLSSYSLAFLYARDLGNER